MLGQIENLLWERYKSITVGIKKHKERWISTVQLALKLFSSQRTFSNNIWFGWREYRNNCSHQVRGCHKYLSVWAPVWCKVFKNLVKKHNVVHIGHSNKDIIVIKQIVFLYCYSNRTHSNNDDNCSHKAKSVKRLNKKWVKLRTVTWQLWRFSLGPWII